MSKVIYRSIDIADIPQVSELRIKLQCEVHGINPEEVPAEYVRKCAAYFEKAIKSKHYFGAVAEVDEKLVSINGLIVYEKPPSLKDSSTLVGYVTNVYTLPDYRGQGMAGELMKIIIDIAKASALTKLHLGSTDDGKSVYIKAGFKPTEFESLELKL